MSETASIEDLLIKEENFETSYNTIREALDKIMQCGRFTSYDGAELYYERYEAPSAVDNIVILHGFTEFTKKFTEMIWYMTSLGHNVFIFDQRGHGLSERKLDDLHLAHIDRFDDYVKDFDVFVKEQVLKHSKGLPLYLMAHSMGCAVALLWMQENTDTFVKCVMSSPMVYPTTGGIPRRAVKRFVIKEAEKYGWENKFKYAGTFDPYPDFRMSADMSESRFNVNMQIRRENQLYQNSSATNRWIYEGITVGDRILVRQKLKNIGTDVLIFSCDRDRVVHTAYHKKLNKQLGSSRIVILKNSKHTPFTGTEDTLKKYYGEIFGFFAHK